MFTLLRHLLGRLIRGRRMIGMLALASVSGVAVWLSSLELSANGVARQYHALSASVGAGTISIVALVLGVNTLREERDEGTLPYLFLKPIARTRFAASAWLAGSLASMAVAAAGWAVGWIAAGSLSGSWTLALPQLPAFLAAAVGYASLFVPLGYLVPRAILVGLAYVFVWEGIIATVVPGLAQWSVWRISLSVAADLTELPPDALEILGPVSPGIGGALAKLAVVALIGYAALTLALLHRDAL